MRVNFSKAVAIAKQFDNKINQSHCSEKKWRIELGFIF
jgi:hypothetical protein